MTNYNMYIHYKFDENRWSIIQILLREGGRWKKGVWGGEREREDRISPYNRSIVLHFMGQVVWK